MKSSAKISERQTPPNIIIARATNSRKLGTTIIPLALLLCMVSGLNMATAQESNATLTGVVKDPSGSVIPGATVTATNTGTGIEKAATSDDAGRYTIQSLAPGIYDVSATHTGFATVTRAKQEFLVGTIVTLDFSLPVSSVTETVQVTEAPPAIEPEQSMVTQILETQQMDSLPVINRQFADLAVMTPGVLASGVSHGGASTLTSAAVAIGNSPTYQTGYAVDGISMEEGNQGGEFLTISQDWIQEFSVLALQFPAEYGSATGGIINAVTRSGTNKMHGRVYAYYQNGTWNSNPEFYTGVTKAPFNSNRYGGMLGGPVIKDKLFYFAGYEYFNQLQSSSLSSAYTTANSGAFAATAQPVGTPVAQLVPWLVYGTQTTLDVTTGSELAILRLDYTPNSKNSFQLRGDLDYETVVNSGFGSTTPYGRAEHLWDPNSGELFSWTRTISSHSVNDLRAAFYIHAGGVGNNSNYGLATGFYNASVAPPLNANPYNYLTTSSLGGITPFGNPDGWWAEASYNATSTGGSLSSLVNANKLGVVQEQYSHILGNHSLKFGGDFFQYANWSTNADHGQTGAYSFTATAGPFNPNTAVTSATGLTGYTVLLTDAYDLRNYYINSSAFGIFAEDTWKKSPNLTFNIGLRYDFGDVNSALGKGVRPALDAAVPGTHGYIQPGYSDINNDPYDIAPRFGFAWAPQFGKLRGGNTVIRGGFGIFYDQDDTATQAIYIGGGGWATAGYAFATNVATRNPYCIGNTACSVSVPSALQQDVQVVMAAGLANFTVPQFPTSNSACAKAPPCTVTVGPNTYTIPALSIPYNPQGNIATINSNFPVPGTVQGSIGIQHAFTSTFDIAADFAYHYLFHGVQAENTNVALTGPGASQTYTTLNPAFTTNLTEETNTYLVAKDLDVQVHYRDHRGDMAALAYQFGYAHDDSVDGELISSVSANATDPFNIKVDEGPSALDVRNVVNLSGNANLHWGIQLAPILAYSTALPYTATSTVQAPGVQIPGEPAGDDYCPGYYTKCYPQGYTRDSLRGGNFLSLSARLAKTVKFREGWSATAFFEGYNVTNYHALGTNFFTNVDNTATFGKPNGTSVPLRQLQIGGRVDF